MRPLTIRTIFLVAIFLAPSVNAQSTPTNSSTPTVQAQRGALSPEELAKRRQAEQERMATDWAYLAKYRDENAALAPAKPDELRVVFFGDSITQFWGTRGKPFFPGKSYVNRGISGQTTPQMLIRFRQDVIDLHPLVVLILAGVNDIAENTGPATLESIEDNLASMADLARAHRIRVVLCSVLPAADFPWHHGLDPASKVAALNSWIKDYTAKNNFTYLDYYSAMVDARGALRDDLGVDGVHPNQAGYDVMTPLAESAIAASLKSRP